MNLLYDGATAEVAPICWRFGQAELDERQARLSVAGHAVALDRSAYDLLRCLLHQAGEVVSKNDLMRAGWPGRVVSENSLAKAIGRIRAALRDDGECIRVVPGYGYRLIAEVQGIADGDASAKAPAAGNGAVAAGPALPSGDDSTRASRVRPLRWRLAVVALVLALAVLAGIAGARRNDVPESGAAAPPEPAALSSIAVLPFMDLSAQHDQTYFSDGLAEQLLDELSRVPQLKVVGRTSSFAFRDRKVDIQTIGRELHAATVLEGSVRKSAERIRVTVQLINSADGYHLWSQTYDRPVAEIFALQDEIARAIVGALRIELLPEQLQGLARHGTRNAEAYTQYLLAQHTFQDDETAQRRALAAYERAVELDPGFADAWLRIADILGHSGMYADGAKEALEGKRRAMQAINHVIELAPERADAYLMRADFRYAHWWDWQGAAQDLELGAARSSHDDELYLMRRCRLSAALGRLPEAIATAQRATQVNPMSGAAWTVMGYHQIALGQFDRAHDALTQAVRNQQLDEHAHYYLGLAEVLQGRPAAALPHFEDSAHFLRLTGLAIAHHSLGDADASERNLQVLISRFGHITPYQAAEVYAWRGEKDQAFQWLQRSCELHDASIMYLTFDPLLRNLRSDPRYRALLVKVGLPATEAVAAN